MLYFKKSSSKNSTILYKEKKARRKTGKKLNAKDAATMKVIDLTHTITEKMPVFPGT